MKTLVDFGNYLLSEERRKLTEGREGAELVSDADIQNFLDGKDVDAGSWRSRLMEEEAELSLRIIALERALKERADDSLLVIQFHAMKAYHEVLTARMRLYGLA